MGKALTEFYGWNITDLTKKGATGPKIAQQIRAWRQLNSPATIAKSFLFVTWNLNECVKGDWTPRKWWDKVWLGACDQLKTEFSYFGHGILRLGGFSEGFGQQPHPKYDVYAARIREYARAICLPVVDGVQDMIDMRRRLSQD